MQSFRPELLLACASCVLALASCTDDVDLDSSFETAQPVVDAWLTTQSEPQSVLLTQSQDYYANALPPPIEGAVVFVCRTLDTAVCADFMDEGNGRYVWRPGAAGEVLAEVGDELALFVELPSGKTLAAATTVYRTAPIDSVSLRFEESELGRDEGIYGEVFARDLPGAGDRYLIRSQVNDTVLNRIQELNLAFDAAFDGGTTTDGVYFIAPIRSSVNKVDDDGGVVPLVAGDTMRVEVWSLSPAAFTFLQQAATQIQSGDSQLFSVPVVNVRGNVLDSETGDPALGMFSVSAVSEAMNVAE